MSHITYSESNWLFPREPLVTHDISVADINYLWNCAFQDDAWAEGVTEQVKAYDRNPGSGRDYLIDEVRIRNAGGTTIHFPFGDRIITFSSKPHFYRGENQDFSSSIPSLRRKTRNKSPKEEELLRSIANMRVWQFWKLIWNIRVVPYWEAKLSDVNYKALAQHYGFDTYLLDLTNDFRIALFFATTKYVPETDSFRPLIQADIDGAHRFGVIYHTPNHTIDFINPGGSFQWLMEHMNDDVSVRYGLDSGDLDGMAFQIGYQPLMRCHHQSGYVYPMRNALPLNEDRNFERLRFRQTVELSRSVYEAMDGGKKVFPQEGINEIRDILKLIQGSNTFSKDDMLCAYTIDAVNKELFLSVEDFETALAEFGVKIVPDEVEYLNDRNRLIPVNAKYDGKDLLAPIGGILHMKPEDRKFRENRCMEIYGKLID